MTMGELQTRMYRCWLAIAPLVLDAEGDCAREDAARNAPGISAHYDLLQYCLREIQRREAATSAGALNDVLKASARVTYHLSIGEASC